MTTIIPQLKPGQRHPNTQMLVDELRQTDVATFVPYDGMSQLIGADVYDGARCYLNSARDILRRDYQIEFSPAKQFDKRGIIRLNSEEIAGKTGSQVRRTYNSARKGARIASCADHAQIPQSARAQFVAATSVLAVIAHASKPRTLSRLADVTNATEKRLELQGTLEFLARGKANESK